MQIPCGGERLAHARKERTKTERVRGSKVGDGTAEVNRGQTLQFWNVCLS